MIDVRSTIEKVNGFKVAGVHAGLKPDGALDFALFVSDRPCLAAAVFTTNEVKSAHVLEGMDKLQRNSRSIRAVAINTKCANACTGQQGIDNARQMARWVAERIGCGEDEVLVMSTGVIGTQLPMDKIRRGIDLAADALGDDWEAAARAIMTTDTRPKQASVISESGYQVAGVVKGSGMIAPNMATMLSLIVTDAGFSDVRPVQTALQTVAASTYNCIVVDGDMSTNDTVLLLANGASGVMLDGAREQVDFHHALELTSTQLAQDVVRDGEGVTKFITLHVLGAESDAAARTIANTIATSPLVKTAFHGGDANWGRIIAAAGRSGIALQPEKMRLHISTGVPEGDDDRGLLLFESGIPTHYSEARAGEIMSAPEITIVLDCGQGEGAATVWTCDLSHDYVSINGHYRT